MRKKYLISAKCYDKKGRLISEGENNYKKTHPLMLYFASKVHLHDKIYLHAEVQALIRCGDKKPWRISIARYNEDGSLALAKPCPVCAEAIKAFGVKEVCYTSEHGLVEEFV